MADMGSAIAFVHNFGEMTLFADQPVNGLVEDHRKPPAIPAHHLPCDPELIFKFENRELEFDGLTVGDATRGIDKHPGGTDILDDVPEGPLFDAIFRNNERRAAGVSTLILIYF